MFHTREVDWSQYTSNGATVVIDTRNGERRLLAQSPIPMEYLVHESEPNNEDDDSDGYGTPDEEFDNDAEIYDVQDGTTSERKLFSTPCGQTYWVDGELYLYTNETVEIPIGYWCERDQCIYLDDGSGDSTDDEYEPPPTPPPLYVESESVQGSPATIDTNSDNEVEGETIVLFNMV